MREITDRLHEKRQIELAKSILESHGYTVSRVVESNQFLTGDVIEWSGLYGGPYTGKVTQVGKDFIKLDVSWTAEDTGETVTDEDVYDKTVDPDGDECIIVWKYYGECGYVYPPERNPSDVKESN